MHHLQVYQTFILLIGVLYGWNMQRVIGLSIRRANRRRAATPMTSFARRLVTITYERHSSVVLSSVNNNNESLDDGYPSDELLQRLEQEIAQYNHGNILNVNSPKQVSLAIFGTVQSTSREVLMKASQGEGVEYERQQKLAKLVLQHRSLTLRKNVRDSTKPQLKSKSTITNAAGACIEEEHVEINGAVVQPASELKSEGAATGTSQASFSKPLTPYQQSVDSLFDGRGSKLHSYWKDAILQVTKPSARSMVLQLNPDICPMGFDPSASPGIVKSCANSEAGKKGSLLHYVRQQKTKYFDCIILTRVGEFYETYGMDAVLLVEVSSVKHVFFLLASFIYR